MLSLQRLTPGTLGQRAFKSLEAKLTYEKSGGVFVSLWDRSDLRALVGLDGVKSLRLQQLNASERALPLAKLPADETSAY